MKETTVRFHVQMLETTRNAIKRAARARGMSANAWIVWQLTEAVRLEELAVAAQPTDDKEPTP